MERRVIIFLGYVIIMTIFSLISMADDKKRMIKKLWRVPSNVIFFLGLLGGSLGIIIGMFSFRHKMNKWYFLYGMPFVFFVQVFFSLFFLVPPFHDAVIRIIQGLILAFKL